MARRPSLVRHQILLPEGMWDEIGDYYPEHSRSEAIRAIIQVHLARCRESRYSIKVPVELEKDK
mgnify:CR=1 FL=1